MGYFTEKQAEIGCCGPFMLEMSRISILPYLEMAKQKLQDQQRTWTRFSCNTRSCMFHKATCTPTADNTLLRADKWCAVTSFRTSCSTSVMNFVSGTWWCGWFCSRLNWTHTEYNIQINSTDTWTILNLHIEELTPPKKKVDISNTVNKGVKHPPNVFHWNRLSSWLFCDLYYISCTLCFLGIAEIMVAIYLQSFALKHCELFFSSLLSYCCNLACCSIHPSPPLPQPLPAMPYKLSTGNNTIHWLIW